MPTKMEHALALAERGFYVFPCEENSKKPKPFCKWRQESSRKPSTIQTWWEQNAEYNIGIDCGKSHLYVIDIDCKEGKQGNETFSELRKDHDFPVTLVARTPTGGRHLLYAAEGLHNTAEALGPGIDTRGEGGYIVAAGSAIDAQPYLFEDPACPVSPLPQWLETLVPRSKPNGHLVSAKVISEDNPDDLHWAVQYLKEEAPEAIEGSGGHDTLVRVAMQLKDHGIDPETAIDLMAEHWNERCSPPWELSELSEQVKSSYKSAKNPQGLKTPQAEFTVPKNPSMLNAYLHLPADRIPRRQWVFGAIAMRKQVTIIVAPPGMGKSTLTLAMVLSKASGKPLLDIDPIQAGAVALWNNEDNMEEMRRRLLGTMAKHDLAPADFGERLYLNCGEDRPLRIAKRKDGKLSPQDAEELTQALIELKIDLLVVDPLAETHPAKENENEEMLTIGRMYRSVAQRADCAVVLVHHTRKLDGASSDGHSGNLDSMRGASSLGGLARVVLTFNTMSQKQAKTYGKNDDERHRFVLLETAKANMSAPGSNKLWFERQSVTLENGDAVGVLVPSCLKEIIQPETTSDIILARDIMQSIGKATVPLSEITKSLLATHGYAGLKYDTLYRKLLRLFEADDPVSAPGGVLIPSTAMGTKNREVKTIRYEQLSESKSPSDLLF